jgi:hypothetical protein
MWIIDIWIAHILPATAMYSCKKLSVCMHVRVSVMVAVYTELDICRRINNQFI